MTASLLWLTSRLTTRSPPPTSNFDATPLPPIDDYLKLDKQQRDKDFVNTFDASDKYGIPQRTIQHWVNLGQISAVQIGKRNLKVDLRSVEAFLRQRAAQREKI